MDLRLDQTWWDSTHHNGRICPQDAHRDVYGSEMALERHSTRLLLVDRGFGTPLPDENRKTIKAVFKPNSWSVNLVAHPVGIVRPTGGFQVDYLPNRSSTALIARWF